LGNKNCLGNNKRKYIMAVNEISAASAPRVEEQQVRRREEPKVSEAPKKEEPKNEEPKNKDGFIVTV
jgi:hypothetical protein